MRVVLQRVTRAEVRIADRVSGRIGPGLVLLAGFSREDTDEVLTWMADKILSLRVFPDPDQLAKPSSFSLDVTETGGSLLVVSQFTLYGDASRGRRPGFTAAAPPDIAVPLYERFIELLRGRAPGRIETGEFGAAMQVDLVNDGPVTLILER